MKTESCDGCEELNIFLYQPSLIVSKWYHYIKFCFAFCFHLNTAKLSIDFESVCLKFVHLEPFISIWISLYSRTCINSLSCYLYSVQIEVNLWLSGQNILVCAFLKRKNLISNGLNRVKGKHATFPWHQLQDMKLW